MSMKHLNTHDEMQRLVNIHKSEGLATLVACAKGLVGPSDIRFGGTLIPETANAFITDIFADPFLQRVTTRRMARTTAEGGVLGRGRRRLQDWAEGSEPTSTAGVSNNNYKLTAKPVKLPVDIGYSFFVDNQDNPNLRTELEAAFVSEIQEDLTDLAFNGDEGAAPGGDHDFLVLNDGWLALAADSNLVQKVTIDPTNDGWIDTLDKVLEPMSARHRRNAQFIVNTVDRDKYGIEIGQHVTGVSAIANERASALVTYPVLDQSVFPEKTVLMTDPRNLVYGIAMDIRRSVEDVPRKSCFQFTWQMWVDFEIAQKHAAVLGRVA